MSPADTRSIGDLVAELVGDLSDLVRKEGQLVRAEISEKASAIGRAGGLAAAGGVCLLGAFLVLLEVLVLALSKAMDPLWASIIVAVAVGAIGFVLVRMAMKKIRPAELAPHRSTEQLRKDIRLVRRDAGELKEQAS